MYNILKAELARAFPKSDLFVCSELGGAFDVHGEICAQRNPEPTEIARRRKCPIKEKVYWQRRMDS